MKSIRELYQELLYNTSMSDAEDHQMQGDPGGEVACSCTLASSPRLLYHSMFNYFKANYLSLASQPEFLI